MATAADILKQSAAKETVLKTVQIDGLALLKIMQHCDAVPTNIVTGQLLGLDVGQTMEVTDCYPFPVSPSSSTACSMLTRTAQHSSHALQRQRLPPSPPSCLPGRLSPCTIRTRRMLMLTPPCQHTRLT